MPADFSGCFGIKSSTDCNGLIYDTSAPVQLTVKSFPEFAESIGGTFEWFGGNSCSAAIISGTAAQVLKRFPKNSSNVKLFENYLLKNQNTLFIKKANEIVHKEDISELFIKCYDIFSNYVKCNEISPETALISENRIITKDAYAMIKACEKRLCINIPYKKISYIDFSDISHFLSFIRSVINFPK